MLQIIKEEDVKNCPCCGGRAKIRKGTYTTTEFGVTVKKQWFGSYCTICRLSQPSRQYFSKQDACNKWNSRVE